MTPAEPAFDPFRRPHERRKSLTAPFAIFRSISSLTVAQLLSEANAHFLKKMGSAPHVTGTSPERKSRRRGGLTSRPRVPCLPALPPPLTARPVPDSLDIATLNYPGYRAPVGLGVPGRAAIVDSCARLGLARGRARTAPPWDPAPGGNAPLHCGSKLDLQPRSGDGPASLGLRPDPVPRSGLS